MRVARHLTLAYEIERRLASAARTYGLTRAPVTQIVNLTRLDPAIQEEIRAILPITVGRDPVTDPQEDLSIQLRSGRRARPSF